LIFNQSLAHASHGKGALNAFDINLSPGGTKKGEPKLPQNNTYFPLEYRFPELCGQVQYLWQLNKKGEKEEKGLKQIL
jgi:hypothetical protein